MKKKLSLAYSTCPNDTYIFYGLAHQKIDMHGLRFEITLNDVEHLNQQAKRGVVDISKLSFAAIGHLMDHYGLLRSGAALGRGCGPLLVSRKGTSLPLLETRKIAIPGLWTTANLLLGLYMKKQPDVVPMTFDKIIPAVSAGEYDFGVIIHEGRFTYQNYGLNCLIDLGEWWESVTSLPIPLGGIAIRRDLPEDIIRKTELLIRKSIQFARLNPSEPLPYVKTHARELSDEVIGDHISLYVNAFSLDIGAEGEAAIDGLFEKAVTRGLIPKCHKPLLAGSGR